MNPAPVEGYAAAPASPEHPLLPVARSHAVTHASPAKKITFFKSGDPQFSGVKMAINRRSFKSFSALMDDLSHRVPLPFGVRTITTPRGTHGINRLEQLEDGGHYVCSDKKYAHPIGVGGTGRKVGQPRASHPVGARKPSQQEEAYPAAHFQQVPKTRKKITLVKNGDPTLRRPVILNRRNARNFKTFLEDASDLLQFTVKRLYTVDGRRIENIQAVLQSPSVLICVGRELFKPIQTDNVRKSIAEKLPGLRSNPSIASEAMESKKNANFGLKAKKSVIHPRSASSNKTRFSLSSEKSYPNDLNISPVNSGYASFTNACPKSEDTAHSLVNDDIEKRVHVNKDGSLSVEMKVRFHLLNEETLQWSTQIKKSSTLGKTKCDQLGVFEEDGMETKKEMNPESLSETDDSFYPCDADSYSSKLNDGDLEDMYCTQCGMECKDYDIWKNPMHANQQEDYVTRSTWQTRSSASSTSSHRTLMCNQKTSIDSLHTTSSEEYTERIVHKSSCYSETRDNVETKVRYSAVSQCTSQSGVSAAASNIGVKSKNVCKKAGESRNKSDSSLKSRCSLQSQDSVTEHFNGKPHLKSDGGSFEDWIETSPTLYSNRSTNEENGSRRVSIISQSSAQSRKSHRRMHKRGSADTKSIQSNISFKAEEEQGGADFSHNNIRSTSKENSYYDEQCNSECGEQLTACRANNDIIAGDQDNDVLNSAASRTVLSDCERCSTSSHSKNHNKKKAHKSNGSKSHEQGPSHCSSSILKQNSEMILQDDGSLGQCERSVNLEKFHSSPNSSKHLGANAEKHRRDLQTNHSLQSVSSVSDWTSCQGPTHTDSPDSCDEATKSHLEYKPEDDIRTMASCLSKSNMADAEEEDEKVKLPNSRPSSTSQSFSSKYNCVSCPENEMLSSTSSRASSNTEIESKHAESNEMNEDDSPKSSVRETSQRNEKQNSQNKKENISSKALDPKTECVYSPSPPKEKPTNRQLRSAKIKYSSSSVCSDPVKTMNGQIDSSRSSTPSSKIILASNSRASTETCKKIKNTVNNRNSTEEMPNTKNRKNSSSSSKRTLKGEAADTVTKIRSSELIPSALPNVTSEEVVHEWLRKIPSETMVVEYEVEEYQTKACTGAYHEAVDPEMDTKVEERDLSKYYFADMQNNNQVQKETTNGLICINGVNNTPDTVACCNEENDGHVLLDGMQTNNVKHNAVSVAPVWDKNSLPSSIHTSVQIMKALLSHSQESRFDRSNSLPEVSPTMGRKLSNSAKVLISCLAGLQLLDECPPDRKEETKDLNKPKYTELLNIFQALWVDDPANKCVTNTKLDQAKMSSKHYSREDELTPVSSSGVDVNSGFGGSGDGSITGGGDCSMTAEKVDESKLSTEGNAVENQNKNPSNTESDPAVSGDLEKAQHTIQLTPTMIYKGAASLDGANPGDVDENMNQKKVDDSDSNTTEVESKDGMVESLKSDNVNNDLIETVENNPCTNDTMKILSNIENKPESNESKSQEANAINSQSDCQSTVNSNSDSNGINEPLNNKQSFDANPVWALKLLKKIEKEFMTHYVDAMNEFKIRWNLENNDNLDDMIAELKNEVSQRIQRSIEKELTKIKSRVGQKLPRPPDESPRRKSSLQAEQRRKRLQSMHKRSVSYLSGKNNKEAGTNYTSCETDEEDLTFSASFGDDANGQPNDNEFCPCETCIRKQRALKVAKPNLVAADAPIMRAFDLQQILKMKRENNEVNNEEMTIPSLGEHNKELDDLGTENECTEETVNEINPSEDDSLCNSTMAEKVRNTNSEQANEDNETEDNDDRPPTVDENGDCNTDDLRCEEADTMVNSDQDIECKSNNELEPETDTTNTDNKEKRSDSASADAERLNMECTMEDENTCVYEEEQLNCQENGSPNLYEDHAVDQDSLSAVGNEEKEEAKESLEDVCEPSTSEVADDVSEEGSENGDKDGNHEMPNPVINTEINKYQDGIEVLEQNGAVFQISCLGRECLITQNDSVDDADVEYKNMDNNIGETSLNGHANISDSKQPQMYPDSSSDDDDRASACASPAGTNKNEIVGNLHVNNKESFDGNESRLKKSSDDHVIEQDDFDF
ncbi:retinitis pigmentosa 1-like 1 protein [Ascaphus truei]|uniref:retinitis pigmentosa 1-like 1 protein n=1 Tax=Ascaphus truei TaxID=8439 RepID=UPI003F597FB8